ncbi:MULTISPECIES: hypothetical protein [unclassified Shewanella]|uniref:hypothetical protein n=1 Tax=unclassified Shewanella TaxID=196818 RepID=UPI0020031BBA|nr:MULTISPECIES: hypothetical protein [unclassified Shewanella]MCK7634077.1 hypothetical protein [Shewanella sp. JNE17]MCK7649302.1 hypothetical protein [Shewanella sp. JNE8]MCK7657383.1 hypothetical protein [Shewanella sp. JNE4-2]
MSLGLGLAGMLLSYYFYTISIKIREPAFVITKNVSLFSSPKGLSSKYFKIVKSSDGTELLKNLYIQEVAIWNNGKESIKKENVLKPITLTFNGEIEIIDAFISEVKRPDIVKGKISFKPGENVVTTSFSILENNDGMKIQVVYASLESSIANVDGVIEGVEAIQNIDNLAKDNLLASVAKVLMWGGVILVGFLLLGSIGKISKWVVSKTCGDYAEKVNSIITNMFSIVMTLFFLGLIAVLIYTKVIEFSKESVVDSVPKMEVQTYNKPLK